MCNQEKAISTLTYKLPPHNIACQPLGLLLTPTVKRNVVEENGSGRQEGLIVREVDVGEEGLPFQNVKTHQRKP